MPSESQPSSAPPNGPESRGFGGPAPLGAPSAATLVVAATLLGLAFVPSPVDRAVGSDDARTLVEFLELRAALHVPLPVGLADALDPLPPIRVGPRGCELLLPRVVERDDYRFDERAEIGFAGESFVTAQRGAGAAGLAVVVLADDVLALPGELADASRAGLQARLAEDLLERAPSGVASVDLGFGEGGSPLLQLARLERYDPERSFDRIVAVWSLDDDLAQTDLVRRVVCFVPPGGDVDALAEALTAGDRGARAAAQEAWLAEHPEGREAVERFLTIAGHELERRARLHGARAHVVLVPSMGATPHTTLLTRRIVDGLVQRGVDVRVFDRAARHGETGGEAWRAALFAEVLRIASS